MPPHVPAPQLVMARFPGLTEEWMAAAVLAVNEEYTELGKAVRQGPLRVAPCGGCGAGAGHAAA